MVTKTSLVNVALGYAMCDRVNAVDTDTSTEAKAARDVYDTKRDSLLRSYLWSFSKKRDTLAPVVTVPDFGVDYAYALPSDYLRTISVHPSDSDFSMCRYKIETILVSATPTLVIVTNIPTAIYLRYVAQVTTVSMFDPMFQEAFAWDLATFFALKIKQSASHAEYCGKEHKKAISIAKSTNSIEDWPDPFPAGSWVNQRFVDGNDAWGGDCWA
jgi:hypothetical protein